MNPIIAYKRGDTVYMGTDTRVIENDMKKTELCPECHKIQRLPNGILLGDCARRELRRVIFAYSEIFTLDKGERLTKEHIIKKIVPSLMAVAKSTGLLQSNDGAPYIKGSICLAYKDVLFEICSNFMVVRYENFLAIGTCDCIQPLLLSVTEADDVNEKIVLALHQLSRSVYSIGAPFLLIDTKEEKFKLVGGEEC